MTDYQRAIHEAGHASIAIEFGITVEFVTIDEILIEGNRFLGLCKWNISAKQKQHPDNPDWLKKKAAFCRAGMEAERRYPLNQTWWQLKTQTIG